ncbi:MAG: hypothetical protein NT118_16285 [Lentisphaerae bacterium]|nr:hypothetical protein [Lentisphaerota bacterium]
MELKTIIIRVKNGDIPKDIDEKVLLIKTIEECVQLETSLIAQIIRTARVEDFNDVEPTWSKWVTEKFAYPKERRCNLNLIGKMLLGMRREYPECYEQLFPIDSEKNRCIASLYKKDSGKKVYEFLRAYDPAKMSREEVRDAVNDCLGIKKDKKSPFTVQQPELPGFKESINNIFINLNQSAVKTFVETLTHDEAKKTTSVAITCLNAVSGYYRKTGDYRNLTVEELNELESYTIKLSKQFGTWRAERATDLKAG